MIMTGVKNKAQSKNNTPIKGFTLKESQPEAKYIKKKRNFYVVFFIYFQKIIDEFYNA